MTRVAIAASSSISAQAGAELADAGGNAVDAVIGAAIVSMCTDIGIMSPGGGALIAVWPPTGDPVVVEGCPEMPGRGLDPASFGKGMREVTFDYGGITRQRIGYGSVATPGAFAAMSAASKAYGSLSWSEVLAPAIRWATEGFPLGGGAAEYLRYTHEAIYSWSEESYRLLHRKDGSPLAEGDNVFIPHLARSLEDIAMLGVEALYAGDLGEKIIAAVQSNGGPLNGDDLRAYRAEAHRPLSLEFEDWRIATCPPPSIGGACLAAMLQLLKRYPQRDFDRDAVGRLARVQRDVLGYRAERLDVAGEEFPKEVERLLTLVEKGNGIGMLSAPSTIHISGIDSNGLACSLTASAGYGSGAMATGTGMFLNNSLGEVDLHPEGLKGIVPGTRLVSNMAPTVARSVEGELLAIGSPGASRITTAIAQTLWHHLHFNETLAAAIEHPRLHVEFDADQATIAYEKGLPVPADDTFGLREFDRLMMYFGGVQAVRWSPSEGFAAFADTRRSGQVAYGGFGLGMGSQTP